MLGRDSLVIYISVIQIFKVLIWFIGIPKASEIDRKAIPKQIAHRKDRDFYWAVLRLTSNH